MIERRCDIVIPSFRYEEERSYDGVHLRVQYRTLSRDPLPAGDRALVQIASIERIPHGAWHCMDSHMKTRAAYEACRKALMHELDECFLVNGVRVYDPHKGEAA